MMFRNMLIRKKILYSTIALTVSLILLMLCSLRGIYKYRDLTRSIGILSAEVKEIWRLNNYVFEMRTYLRPIEGYSTQRLGVRSVRQAQSRAELLGTLDFLRRELDAHHQRIRAHLAALDPLLATNEHELRRIEEIQRKIAMIERDAYDPDVDRTARIEEQLEALSLDFNELFGYLTDRMAGFREEMRARYRTWIGMIVVTSLVSLMIVAGSFAFFRRGVVQPFKVLLEESRRIAQGDFDHRIGLKSQDELGELAEAMNAMTDRFMEINSKLNKLVEQRTREVVRSEQLASVGYLAAGLAHEINNPLGAIAWSVDALESRLHDLLQPRPQSLPSAPAASSQTSPPAAEAAGLEVSGTVKARQGGSGTMEARHGVSGYNSDSAVFPVDVPPTDGAAERLCDSQREEELQIIHNYLNRIQDAAFRCRGILERLLDFARLGESTEPEETDIHQAVREVIDLVRPVRHYQNRPIRFVGIPGLKAWVRPAEFKQVVLNLLNNALDACHDGEGVTVTLEAKADHFVLRVEDEGCGMTEEVLNQLFIPFFTRRRDGRGTGLGLSVSFQIVQDHGGEIVATSPGPGQGSTVTLKLPIHPQGTSHHVAKAA